ncbi:MAG TPA: GDSL-type esterase/lipase family protein [Bryobacteraceae bacterium]|nr:GDSL-type esterase/lipase family protein [Bryobacteraceae bacterium]
MLLIRMVKVFLLALFMTRWATVWSGSVHGPYPAGNAVAQPDLHAVFPDASANDQTFRLILRPNLWSGKMRLRFSNVLGSRPIQLDGVYAGVHASAGRLIAGTNRPVHFHAGNAVTIKPGRSIWSDAVDFGRVDSERKMAVSFHVVGESGPMTWHAKAMQTSYVSRPHGGAHGSEETSDAFPFTTTSWYFLDAVDAMLPAGTKVVVAFGDSITDGTNSTINGDDRWPDFFAARVPRMVVVNAGIGGNQVVSSAAAGGPSALERLDRDVLGLSGVTAVIWLEGINDLGSAKATADVVIAGFKEGIARLHARGIRVTGATITSSLHSTATHGTPEVDAHRKAVNEFIRHGGAFDSVADFDAATLDPESDTLRPEFQPSSSTGGPGDRLHPNRAGYQAMANSIDLIQFQP